MTDELPVCTVCGEPSMTHLNGTPTCSEHFFEVLDNHVALLAKEKGIPLDDARRAFAKLLRELS